MSINNYIITTEAFLLPALHSSSPSPSSPFPSPCWAPTHRRPWSLEWVAKSLCRPGPESRSSLYKTEQEAPSHATGPSDFRTGRNHLLNLLLSAFTKLVPVYIPYLLKKTYSEIANAITEGGEPGGQEDSAVSRISLSFLSTWVQ